MAEVHLAALDRHPLRTIRVVDLLRERLDRVERGDEQRDAGHDDERRRAAPGAVRAEPGDRAERGDATDPGDRPPQDALPVPAPARVAERLPRRAAGTTASAGTAPARAGGAGRSRCGDPGASPRTAARRRAPTGAPRPRSTCRRCRAARRPGRRARPARRRSRSAARSSGQNASAPSIDAGDVITPPKTSSSDHATSTTPISAVTSRPSRRPDATQRAPPDREHRRAAGHGPGDDPTRDVASSLAFGTRCATSSPASAPPTSPTSATPRSCRYADARSTTARSAGASSTWLTSAGSSASGPPRAPGAQPERDRHRDDEPDHRRTVVAQVLDRAPPERASRRRSRRT